MQTADATGSLVIMQASRGTQLFAKDIVLAHLIRAAIELYLHIPVCMRQDHRNSAGTCKSALMNNKSEFDQLKYLAPGIAAMSAVCKDRSEGFHRAGDAAKAKAVRLL